MAVNTATEVRLVHALKDRDAAQDMITQINLGVGIYSATTLGFYGATPVVQAAAPTTQLTQITPADAVGTPDYAIAAITNTGPFGFSNAAEAITLLYVVQNLQIRVGQLALALKNVGITA